MSASGAPLIGGRDDDSASSESASNVPSLRGTLVLAALVIALLAADIRFLWSTASDHVEGDVLIHLVFARNMARGHLFEYGYQQPSRAETSLMWEGLLAIVGRVTGESTHHEGFLLTARILSAIFLALFAALFFKALRQLSVRRATAAMVAALAIVNPVTFYWCIASPMETALAMVVVALLLLQALRMQRATSGRPATLIVLASLTFLALLVRPEIILLCGLTAIATAYRNGRPEWKNMLMYLAAVAVGFVAYSGLMLFAGVSPIPNAGAARRLYLRTFDAHSFPIFHFPWSFDSWIFVILFSPLVIGALLAWRRKQIGRAAPLAVAWLLVTAFFFSFYYYSSWRGRYLLPVLGSLAPIGLAGLLHARQHARLLRLALPTWYAGVCAVCLYPLALHVREGIAHDTTAGAADLISTDHPPLKFMVQEAQCVFYDPNLIILSTDGLIDLKAYDAHKSGTTVEDFILREKPDLLGAGRFYLPDPTGAEKAIYQTLQSKGRLQIGGMTFAYAGTIRGGGPALRAEGVSVLKRSDHSVFASR